MRILAYLVALLILSACSQDNLLQKFSSPEDRATAKAYIDRLRARDFDAIEKATDQSIKGPTLHDTLVAMADLIPAQEPTSMKLVGAQTFHMADATTVNTTFEYNFGGTWLLANVAVQEKNGLKTIVGFHVNPESQSLASRNRFTLAGKSTIQYVFLAAASFVALLTLYALIVCIRTKVSGRKWPWVLFIIVGFGKVALNWTTGQWSITPLSIQFFSASASAQLYGPWVVAVSLPIGAICFLLFRRARHAATAGSQHVAATDAASRRG